MNKYLYYGALPWERDGGAVVNYYLLHKQHEMRPEDEYWGVPKVPTEVSPDSIKFVNIPFNVETHQQVVDLMDEERIPLVNIFHIERHKIESMIDPLHSIGGKMVLHQTIHWRDDDILKMGDKLHDIDMIVCPTQYAQKVFMFDMKMPREQTTVIPHAVDITKFKRAVGTKRNLVKAKWGIRPEQMVLLYSGRLGSWKGVPQLIPIVRSLVKDYDCVFIFRGNAFDEEGKRIAYILDRMQKNNPNVLFLSNWQPPEVMEELYSFTDILLFNCHDEKTRAVTEDGLKDISEITYDDKVWSLNNDGELELVNIKNIYVYDNYDGEMFRLNNKQISLFITPEHELLYTTQKKRNEFQKGKVKELKKSRYYLPTTGKWNGLDIDFIKVKDLVDIELFHTAKKLPEYVDIGALLSLLGWYISEGMLSIGTNCKNYNVIHIYNSNEENKDEICELANKIGLHGVKRDNEVIINSIELCEIFSTAGMGAKNKKIPKWALQFSSRLLGRLYNSLMKGDGSRAGNYSGVYYTSSDKLMETFCELVLKLGYSPKFYRRKTDGGIFGEKEFPATESWAISVREINNKGTLKPEHITKNNYKGLIWCLETENGNFFTERDGLLVCSGNSAHEGFGVPLIEAQAVGACPVTTALANHVEICGNDGFAGKIVAPTVQVGTVNDGTAVKVGSSDAIYGSVKWLLESPQEMRVMGENGMHNVRTRFTLEENVKKWLELYDLMIPEGYDMTEAATFA
jgi:glycosyltransferase involved in cell wall biosynthesis